MTASRFILQAKAPRDAVIAKLIRHLHGLAENKPWKIEVDRYVRTRSTAQNAYLHGVAYKILSDATGYEPQDVAEYCLGSYFGWRDKKVPKTPRNPEGIESVPVRSTTRNEDGKRDVLAWDAFAEYVDWIQRFGAKHNIHIPDPDPDYRQKDKAA